MTRWSVVVAAAGATASSGTTVLLLGNPGLQRAVTGTLPELFGASAAFVAAGAVAFALTFVLARALRLAPRDVWAVALGAPGPRCPRHGSGESSGGRTQRGKSGTARYGVLGPLSLGPPVRCRGRRSLAGRTQNHLDCEHLAVRDAGDTGEWRHPAHSPRRSRSEVSCGRGHPAPRFTVAPDP